MKKILLTHNLSAIVDDKDYKFLSKYKWYARIRHDKKTAYAVRAIYSNGKQKILRMHCILLNNIYVDHINGDGLDNRRKNLRIATHQQNMCNCKRKKSSNSSKYRGVYFKKNKNRWSAQIGFKNEKIHIGYFSTEIEAGLAYDEVARKLHKDFAVTNFNKK